MTHDLGARPPLPLQELSQGGAGGLGWSCLWERSPFRLISGPGGHAGPRLACWDPAARRIFYPGPAKLRGVDMR